MVTTVVPRSAPTQPRVVEWIATRPDVVSRLRREPPERVLVLRSRTGEEAIALASQFPNLTVYGIDPDPDAVAAAQEAARLTTARDRVVFVVGSDTDPHLSMAFDVVIAAGVLTDPATEGGIGVAALLQVMSSRLVNGGLALLDCPLELTDDAVRPAGFVSVEQVGLSESGAPAYLLRR